MFVQFNWILCSSASIGFRGLGGSSLKPHICTHSFSERHTSLFLYKILVCKLVCYLGLQSVSAKSLDARQQELCSVENDTHLNLIYTGQCEKKSPFIMSLLYALKGPYVFCLHWGNGRVFAIKNKVH